MSQSSAAASASPLPSPAERPGAAIVIFDGDCRFCTAQVSRLARWDSQKQLAFLSLHDPIVAKRWPELTHDMLMRHMYVITPDGQRLRGAAGFRYIANHLPRLWPLRLPLSLPGTMGLWQWLYDAFAKRRYWFGKQASCHDGACRVQQK